MKLAQSMGVVGIPTLIILNDDGTVGVEQARVCVFQGKG